MENIKLRARRLNKILVLSLFITAIVLFSNVSMAYFSTMNNSKKRTVNGTDMSNIVTFNDTAPTIDGNLETYAGEWANATVYYNVIDGTNISIRVKANNTHLFFGISYKTSVFVSLNSTNSSQDHTWFAIVFDRNFDNKIGSETAPDDAIVFNYKNYGSVDAYFNGTNPQSILIDTSNGGDENTIGAIQTEQDFIGKYNVTVEIAKKLDSKDIKGNDISLKQSDAIPFAILPFYNYTDHFNNSMVSQAIEWNKLRLEPQQEVFSYVKDLHDLAVVTYITDGVGSAADDYASIGNILSTYGVNSRVWHSDGYDITKEHLDLLNLFILAGNQGSLSAKEVNAIKDYIIGGGTVLILADKISNSSNLNNLLRDFGMEIYNSTLYSNNTAVNASLTLTKDSLSSLDFINENTVLTTDTIQNIAYTGSAIRNTTDFGEQTMYAQECDLYPVLTTEGDYFINLGEQSTFNNTEDMALNNSITLQAALELRYGGRLLVSASSDMFNSTFILKETNRILLLRELQWLLRLQFHINYDNYNVSPTKIQDGNQIFMNISVTGDNNSAINNVSVKGRILVLKSLSQYVVLNTSDNIDFNGTITPNTVASWIDIEILMHKRGYGYNATELFEVQIEKQVTSPLHLNYIVVILFIASVALAGIGSIAIKKHKEEPTENVEELKKNKNTKNKSKKK